MCGENVGGQLCDASLSVSQGISSWEVYSTTVLDIDGQKSSGLILRLKSQFDERFPHSPHVLNPHHLVVGLYSRPNDENTDKNILQVNISLAISEKPILSCESGKVIIRGDFRAVQIFSVIRETDRFPKTLRTTDDGTGIIFP